MRRTCPTKISVPTGRIVDPSATEWIKAGRSTWLGFLLPDTKLTRSAQAPPPLSLTRERDGDVLKALLNRWRWVRKVDASPVAVPIVLTDDEREQLLAWSRRPSSAQALAARSRVVLACAEAGTRTNTQIAEQLGSPATWSTSGVTGSPPIASTVCSTNHARVGPARSATRTSSASSPRPWRPRRRTPRTGRPGQWLPTQACRRPRAPGSGGRSAATTPAGHVKTVEGPAVHRQSPRRRRALPEPARTRRRALRQREIADPGLGPHRPGPADDARHTRTDHHDYVRASTSSLYAALNLTTGKVIGSLHARTRATEFKKFLAPIDQQAPAALDVHVVLDNASTHKTPPSNAGSPPTRDSSCTTPRPEPN
jgi:hypothetical protein